MRSGTIVLLAMAMALLVVTSASGQTAGEPPAEVAETGGERYPTLSAAVAAAVPGATVTLLQDDADASEIVITDRVTIDGDGHSFAGSVTAGEGADATLDDLVMASGALRVAPGGSVTVSECSFGSPVEVGGLIRASGSSFGAGLVSAGGDVTVRGSSFGSSLTLTGTGSIVVSTTSFSSGSGVVLDRSALRSDVDVSPRGSTVFSVDGLTVTSDDTRMTLSDGVLSFMGTASVSGSIPSQIVVEAVGLVTLNGVTGTVWFDGSHVQGIGFTNPGSAVVDTMGMSLNGSVSDAVLHGAFVVSDDLSVGSTLTLPEGSRMTVAEVARVTGGLIVNHGSVDVYGSVSSDIDNTDGTLGAHRGAAITGNVIGNPVVEPVPAAVTMVLEATAGRQFSIVLSPDEGTVITATDMPAWMVIEGSTLHGVPPAAGTYDVTVTASASEYNITLQYRIVVSPAEPVQPSGGGWNWLVVIVVMVIALIVITLMTLSWAGYLGRT